MAILILLKTNTTMLLIISVTNGVQQLWKWIVLSSIAFLLVGCCEKDEIKRCLDLSFPNGYSNVGGNSYMDDEESIILTFSSDSRGFIEESIGPYGSVESTQEGIYYQSGFEVRKHKQVIMDHYKPRFNYSAYIYEGSVSDTLTMLFLVLSDENENRIVNSLFGCFEVLSKGNNSELIEVN